MATKRTEIHPFAQVATRNMVQDLLQNIDSLWYRNEVKGPVIARLMEYAQAHGCPVPREENLTVGSIKLLYRFWARKVRKGEHGYGRGGWGKTKARTLDAFMAPGGESGAKMKGSEGAG